MQIIPKLPAELQKAINKIYPSVGEIYLVGGAVRDALLQKTSHDFDFIVKGNALHIARDVADTLKGAFFILNGERKYGRALFSSKEGESYILDFAPMNGGDIQEDLQMRDFTINAMAVDLTQPEKLIDPLGALQDLRKKVLRSCTDKSFTADPVRVLRAVRFLVDFDLEMGKDTLKALIENVSSLSQVSDERRRDELFRILEGKTAVEAVRKMDALGMLPFILPELVELKDFSQSPPHVFNGWEHTLKVVDHSQCILSFLEGGLIDSIYPPALTKALKGFEKYQMSMQAILKQSFVPQRSTHALFLLAALFHDVGKPHARRRKVGSRTEFIDHARIGAEMAVHRGRELALANRELRWLRSMIGNHMLMHVIPLDAKENEIRRAVFQFYEKTGSAGVFECLLSLADVLATYGETITKERWQQALDRCGLLLDAWFNKYHEWISPDVFYDGSDLQSKFGISPGPELGAVLEQLREAQAAGEVINREDADRLVLAMIKGHQIGKVEKDND